MIQSPIPPTLDLRDMVRQHLVARSLAFMQASAERRLTALRTGAITTYQQTIRSAVCGFYGDLPVGRQYAPVHATPVSQFDKRGSEVLFGSEVPEVLFRTFRSEVPFRYRLENVLFESFPGWQVNATVYVPLDYAPPFPAVVIPVGHSGKQFKDYQLPAQYFARCGYVAVLFDPPGQSGEKQPGNDHFHDGVRCYLTGETSSQYFVADALRCIDYLETRSDVDLRRGVAMTGVSGGGTTTTLAMLLDPRVAVAGPSCCVTPLADLDIAQCYAGCPETHMWRRYAEGIDEVDLLCAAAPLPIMLMAGQHDEVFHLEDTQRLADETRQFYTALGAAERFSFFVDKGGHAYTLAQAREFVRFMNRWLLGEPDRPLPDLPDDLFALDPYSELQCAPRQDVNIFSLTRARAQALEATRDCDPARIRAAVRILTGAPDPTPPPQAVTGAAFQVWTHYWQSILLQPEPGIKLPATLLYPLDHPGPALLHLDDQHRHRLLYRQGPLAQAVHFLQREQPGRAIFTVDLRGWGDSAPAIYPYELAWWGGLDRYLAYTSAALGDAIFSMRVRDALSALAYLRTRPEIDPDQIVLSGCGMGGLVALHVAALDERLQGVKVWDCLSSFRTLLEVEAYTWPADAFVPQVLLHYDLPELIAALPCPVQIDNPLDGGGQRSDSTVPSHDDL